MVAVLEAPANALVKLNEYSSQRQMSYKMEKYSNTASASGQAEEKSTQEYRLKEGEKGSVIRSRTDKNEHQRTDKLRETDIDTSILEWWVSDLSSSVARLRQLRKSQDGKLTPEDQLVVEAKVTQSAQLVAARRDRLTVEFDQNLADRKATEEEQKKLYHSWQASRLDSTS
ncbi:hypothetical protein H6P81_010088 [Aristolochia fimbriata]|uniref:Uncharacterized protein n=1 Tax=Aristolochia fimbriata TaxID=158543 RepID=A0AAV7ES97_ARIFI|nr:hypothetical protein H6P81_010088 [Aristolochia fimbriata]